MRKPNYFPYFLLALFLMITISMSKKTIDNLRDVAVCSFSPMQNFSRVLLKIPDKTYFERDSAEMKKLTLENTMLRNQINGIYEWLFFENRIEDQVEKYKMLKIDDQKDIYLKDFFQRRAEELRDILNAEYRSLPAKVIFRSPSSWSSSLWINVGEKNNEELSKLIIAKNSPVVIGNNLIGIVEHVGYRHSQIRLITDSGFVPSVRAIRGNAQDKNLLTIISSLKDQIYARDDLFTKDDKDHILNILFSLREKLSKKKDEKYLAKGELQGASHPLWRSKGTKLKGIGFNYDYADEEGPKRVLKSGKVIGASNLKSEPLLEKGDLLVTTGMDGLFPKGLNVAIVSRVFPLEDGDFSYNIEAKPTCANLNELEVVMVLPPLGFSVEENK